jgi:hypothetical protein
MKNQCLSARGLWRLFWRAVVLFPVAVILMVLYLAFWTAVFVLPLAAIICAIQSMWLWAAVNIVCWIPLLLVSRWKKLHIDSKDILNERENV